MLHEFVFAASSQIGEKLRLRTLITDDLYQNPFSSSAIEFPIENLLPWAEIKTSGGDRHDNLSAHDLSLHMCIGIILAHVMPILRNRFVRGKLFQPNLVVAVQSWLVIIDEDGGGNVHGVDKEEAFRDLAFTQAFFNLLSDIDEGPPRRHLKP